MRQDTRVAEHDSRIVRSRSSRPTTSRGPTSCGSDMRQHRSAYSLSPLNCEHTQEALAGDSAPPQAGGAAGLLGLGGLPQFPHRGVDGASPGRALQAAARQGNLPLPKGHFPRQTALFLAGCGIHFGWRDAGSWASAMCGILIWAAARGCGIPNLWPIREVSGVLPAILAG